MHPLILYDNFRLRRIGVYWPKDWHNPLSGNLCGKMRDVFYWAVRARVARSTATHLEEAAALQASSLIVEHACWIQSHGVDSTIEHRQRGEAIEKLDLWATLEQLHADYLLRQMVQTIVKRHLTDIFSTKRE